MTLYNVAANEWVDSDHPERGSFFARSGMTEKEIALDWEDAINPSAERLKADALSVLRRERDEALRATDWTQLPDAPADKARWAIYRQQLRDLPANTADPAAVVWPKRPDDADTEAAERELDRAARTVLFDGKNKP